MPLQTGEVWQEVNRELSSEGVRPISPDQKALNNVINIMEDTARRVTSEQNSIMEQQEKEELSQEENMYTEVLEAMQRRDDNLLLWFGGMYLFIMYWIEKYMFHNVFHSCFFPQPVLGGFWFKYSNLLD